MNQGMNRRKQHSETAKNRKKRTEIENCSKSVNRLSLTVYRAPFLIYKFKKRYKVMNFF
jgi:hypothetical protein